MVLVSSGYCFMLMAFVLLRYRRLPLPFGLNWLRVYGMNSIAAYMLTLCIQFRCIPHSLLYGLEPYIGSAWYQVVLRRPRAASLFTGFFGECIVRSYFCACKFQRKHDAMRAIFRRLTYKPPKPEPFQ